MVVDSNRLEMLGTYQDVVTFLLRSYAADKIIYGSVQQRRQLSSKLRNKR